MDKLDISARKGYVMNRKENHFVYVYKRPGKLEAEQKNDDFTKQFWCNDRNKVQCANTGTENTGLCKIHLCRVVRGLSVQHKSDTNTIATGLTVQHTSDTNTIATGLSVQHTSDTNTIATDMSQT